MHVIRRRGWEIPESRATPEHLFLSRRALLSGAASIAAAGALPRAARAEGDPTDDLYPAKKNEKYPLVGTLTPEKISGNYNNFYEFGFDKYIAARAQALKTRPWMVKIDGMVEKAQTVDIDALIRAMPIEERLYRHRCVEAWSMAVPWTGFPMAKLVEYAKPLSGAKYIRMETFLDTGVAPTQKQFWLPWPYVEGVTMAEATSELAFMVTGIYGKPLGKQFGAPLRLALPWKYGFKSVKSIVRIEFTDKRPKSYWEVAQGSEYGFWANVNPAVPHPRWSQATEEDIGTRGRRPTELFNGYGEYVAGLYKGFEGEKLYM
ncbi:MAG TPA: protein-methionine-sulfoxide reductase catalytic subunit MsrP [Xanthobacteraceae bacterium]|nr:protein-methionine-sulfoxide reductase catalytic subunit MsrP [Xanthobacteraceae bacterium]